MNLTPQNTDAKSCYLLFSTTSSLLSRSIRWATKATVSHAAIAYECATTGRVMVLEAAGTGFRGLTWESWLQENDLLHAFRINVPTEQWQAALGGFCDTLGAPYDSRRLVLELARHLSRDWTQRFSWANTEQNSRGVLCADAVADFLYQLGFSQFQCPPAWAPGTLLAHVSEEESFQALSVAGIGVSTMPLKALHTPSAEAEPAKPKRHLRLVA